MSKRELVLSAKKLPPGVRLLCGNPPVLSSEKRKDYESLLGYMVDCVKPTDFIECLWLKDVVDHTWEIRRLRRFKNQLTEIGLLREQTNNDRVRAALSENIRKVVRAAEQYRPNRVDEKEEAPKKPWQQQKRRQRKRRPSEADIVTSFRECINDYQTLDRLLLSAEERRDALLREIERRRDGLGQRLRNASEVVIDAEFSETAIAAE